MLEGMWERGTKPLPAVGEIANWCSHSGSQWGEFSKAKVDLPYDAATHSLACKPTGLDILLQRYSATFTVTLFKRAWKWKQCPSTDDL